MTIIDNIQMASMEEEQHGRPARLRCNGEALFRAAGGTGGITQERLHTLPEALRPESFSDGAFASIIAFLALEILRLGTELLREWSSYLADALAFIYVGVIWLNHHYMFERMCKVDMTLHWINLEIIGTASLIPRRLG